MVARNQVRIIDGTGAAIEIEEGEFSVSEIDAAKELRAVVGIGMEAFYCACEDSTSIGFYSLTVSD